MISKYMEKCRVQDEYQFVLKDLNDANKRLKLPLNDFAKHWISALTELALHDIEHKEVIVNVIKMHILTVRIESPFFIILRYYQKFLIFSSKCTKNLFEKKCTKKFEKICQ